MAACGSIEHIFEKPLPENPTLLESLSPWKHIKSMKTQPKIDDSSFTEIFGELHFKENNSHEQPSSSSSSSSSSLSSSWRDINSPNPTRPGIDIPKKDGISTVHHEKNKNSSSSSYICPKRQYRHSDSFSSMNSESLSLCTEGLGFESFDDVDDLLKNDLWQVQDQGKKSASSRNIHTEINHCTSDYKKSCRSSSGVFPPPISCIGRSGKPWFWFKSYRQDGRFILKEIRIPTQEFLHACREDGRLKLRFIQSDDDILEEDEEEEDDEDEDMCNNDDQNVEINSDCINQGTS